VSILQQQMIGVFMEFIPSYVQADSSSTRWGDGQMEAYAWHLSMW